MVRLVVLLVAAQAARPHSPERGLPYHGNRARIICFGVYGGYAATERMQLWVLYYHLPWWRDAIFVRWRVMPLRGFTLPTARWWFGAHLPSVLPSAPSPLSLRGDSSVVRVDRYDLRPAAWLKLRVAAYYQLYGWISLLLLLYCLLSRRRCLLFRSHYRNNIFLLHGYVRRVARRRGYRSPSLRQPACLAFHALVRAVRRACRHAAAVLAIICGGWQGAYRAGVTCAATVGGTGCQRTRQAGTRRTAGVT